MNTTWQLSCLPAALFLLCLSAADAGDAGWRGDGSGRFPGTQPPTKWSGDSDNVVWKTDVGSGYSSPVLSGDRVFLTAEPFSVVGIDATDGAELWRTEVSYASALGEGEAARIAAIHGELEQKKRTVGKRYNELRKQNPDAPELEQLKEQQQEINERTKEFERQFPPEKRGGAGNAAATIQSRDGVLFALFGTGIAAALDGSGELLWSRHLEAPQQGFGQSASPVIAGGYLVVHIQKLTALDAHTGETVWQADVPAKFGTPAVAQISGTDVIVTPSGSFVRAEDGAVLAGKQFQLSNNSPLIRNDIVYAHEGGTIKALLLPKSAETPFEPEFLWKATGSRDQRMASAVFHDGLLYAAGRKGIMDVTDAETGTLVYRQRTDIGEIFGSPAMAGGMVYFSGKDGKMLVIEPGREYREVSINATERLTASPIFSGSRMYLRAHTSLYCIEGSVD